MSQYAEYGYESGESTQAHEYIVSVLMQLLRRCRPKKILDVGCGNGSLTRKILDQGFDVYGIDASQQGIEIAAQSHPERFFLQDITVARLPAPLSTHAFDTIISAEVIEHLYNPRQFVKYCRDILLQTNGGGHLIITTPYHGYLKNLALALTGKLDEHFTVLWDGGHIKFWSRRTLTALLKEQGFVIRDFKGAGRLPFLWKSMLIHATLN